MRFLPMLFAAFAATAAAAMPKLSGNLRNYAAEKEAFLKEIAAEKDADKLAELKFAYAKFEYASAMDDEPGKWRRAQVAAYEAPGVSAKTKLALLEKGVPGKDFDAEGWKLVENEPKLQYAYFHFIRHSTRFGASGVEERSSSEYRLSVLRKALDTLKGNDRASFVGDYRATLVALGRYEEAEKDCLDAHAAAVASGNHRAIYQACVDLGGFYRNRAARYYSEPEPGLLRKAFSYYRAAIAECRFFDERPGNYAPALSIAMELGDYAEVEKLLVEYRACLAKRNKGDFKPDAVYAATAGDLAYYRGDYEEAVKQYSSVKDLQQRPQHRDEAETAWNRYLGALYATKRYDEALKVLPKLVGWCSLADRNALYKRILTAKAEAAKNP